MRDELDARFAATIAACDGGATRPPGWPPFALPAPLAESIVEAARRGACPPSLIEHYCERMPRMLVEQLRADDAPRRLLHRPLELDALPRTRAALDGLYAALAQAGLDAHAFTGAASARQLVTARPSLAALYAHALFGSGLPFLGVYPTDVPLLARDLSRWGADETIDRRLGCHLVHELAHGPPRPGRAAPSWMVAEAAANHLGAAARAADVFPDERDEGLRAVAPFVLLGDVLARHFGTAQLWRFSTGATAAELFGARVGAAIDAAAWEDWQARQEPPFARDALGVEAWIKLVDAARAGTTIDLASPLATARALEWPSLPWWHAPPADEDFALLPRALTALFQVNALAPDFRTLPSEPPAGRLWLDVPAARLRAEPRPDGVYGEPAWWLMPPPLARRLHERGARRVRIEGATRARRHAIVAALAELCAGQAPLPPEVELSWPSSR